MNGGSRVSIPDKVREVIREIKEITGKHSDDDVYAMLKECNMDPNETTQKLLYLDSFHEVKRKRDRKKLNTSSRVEESRIAIGIQGQGAKGGRGNYSSSFASRGVGGGRSVTTRKENGVNSPMDKGFRTPVAVPEQIVPKSSPNAANDYTMASVVGPGNASNGQTVHERIPQKSAGFCSSASNNVVVQPLDCQISGSDVVKHEMNSQKITAESFTSAAVENEISAHHVGKDLQGTSANALSEDVRLSEPQGDKNVEHFVPLQTSALTMNNSPSDVIQDCQLSEQLTAPSKVAAPKDATLAVKVTSQSVSRAVSKLDTRLAKLYVNANQPVIFPHNLQVPEAIKNGLTFGSLDAAYEQTEQVIDGYIRENDPALVNETVPENEDAARETYMSNQRTSITAQQGDYLVHPECPPNVLELSSLQESVSRDEGVEYEQPKQEDLLPQGGLHHSLQPEPNYSLPSIQPMLGRQLLQSEGPEPQSGNSVISSSRSSLSPGLQPADVAQSSLHASPPPFPFYAHGTAFPPNYFPFNPYFHPFYWASNMHQFVGPTGFSQLPSAGNMFVQSAVSGVKLQTPPGKPGINAGNSTQCVVPSGYGYGSNLAVTSGSNNDSEDSAAAELKESSIYTTMPQGERPIVLLPSSGREIPSFQAHPFYSHLSHGQQLVFAPPQAGHGPFAGLYPPMQATAVSSTTQQLTRHSPTMAGSVDTGGLPPGTYQMAQHGINLNTNY